MQFSELKLGRVVQVKGYLSTPDQVYRKRLIALGLLPGTVFSVLRIAPLGDPIEILVRGIALSLRKKEANILQIEEIP
jgi:ferrous iron transport protein A